MSSSSQSFEHASCNPLRWTLTSMGVLHLCLHLFLILLIGLHVLLSLISIKIAEVISRNLDAFAWAASDMPRIDPDFLCHRLAMDPQVRPIRQRRRKFNEEKRQAIKEETQKLLAAGHIREIQYPEWLANVVLVKKSSGKWRMCIDFTDLNKACLKDSYPLPSIDALVDSASGCKLLSFLDAFSGYNQIKVHPMDEEKTAFMTERSCYCYKVMPFGLNNAGATYQRLMDKVLAPMLGRNV